ncbi:MAG: hypothetical protein ABI616_02350 [Pseudomonadota bacterium]
MIEKQEKEDFDDADDDTSLDGEDVDVARLAREMDLSRSRKPRGTPALRQLELLAEKRRIAELTSDFDDYDIDR